MLELKNSWASVRLERDLSFDLLFWRHWPLLLRTLKRFRPDVIHITGPSHCGILGMAAARYLRIPLAASWHTNLHEYAGQRLSTLVGMLPLRTGQWIAGTTSRLSLAILVQFYKEARLLFAPNRELIDLLAGRTRLPVRPMYRGIDTALFSPERRTRTDNHFVIGYVGRLSSEKNVRLLAELERNLRVRGMKDYRFLVVGHGDESDWLRANLQQAEFPGVLRNEDLARAYASMDVFVFPSTTDTFGNVVLEALSSGVPAIVSEGGGPKFLVDPGGTGYVGRSIDEFADAITRLRDHPEVLATMRLRARQAAAAYSWSAVFEQVYEGYRELATGAAATNTRRRNVRIQPSPAL